MCGIAGFLEARPLAGRRRILQRMADSLRHRGPDDEGNYVDPHAAIGARRLAVMDVAAGRQPIANEDETIHVVLNGEVYNFAARTPRALVPHALGRRGDCPPV